MTTNPVVVVVGDLVTDVVAHLAEPLAIGSDAAAAVGLTGEGSGANVAATSVRRDLMAALSTPLPSAPRPP